MGKLIDETGNKYSEWTVIEYITPDERENRDKSWIAKCSCGTVRPVRINDLRSGKSTNCGCLKIKYKEIPIGSKYGNLTVIERLKGKDSINAQSYDTILNFIKEF